MMNTIIAEIVRQGIILKRNMFRLSDITIWPLILFYSLTLFIVFIKADTSLVALVILGIIGWRIVYHMQIEMTMAYMDHYWQHTLAYTHISPMRISAFIIGNIIVGALKFLLVLIMYLLLAKWMFAFTVPDPFTVTIALLFLGISGIFIGLILFGLTLLYHEHAFNLAYAVPDLLVLLSGVYYPIAIFPVFMQKIAAFLPPFWGFELLKSTVGYGQANYPLLVLSTIAWGAVSLFFLVWCYKRAKKTGRLAKLN